MKAIALPVLLLCALSIGGCDRKSADPPPPDPLAAALASVAVMPSAAPAAQFTRRPAVTVPEGGATAVAVLVRATTAFAKKDWDNLVACWHPNQRERWARELALTTELAAMGKINGEERQLLDSYGAKLTVEERMKGMTLEEIGNTVFTRIHDRDAFLADLLALADRRGATDPAAVLGSSAVMLMPTNPGSIIPDTSKATPLQSASKSALGRAVAQVASVAPSVQASPPTRIPDSTGGAHYAAKAPDGGASVSIDLMKNRDGTFYVDAQ